LCQCTTKETRKHRLFTEKIQLEIIALSVWDKALENQGMIKVDVCEDMSLVVSVIEPLLELVSYKLRSRDEFVAVHALTLGDEGLGSSLFFDTMLVIRESGCFVLHAQDDFEMSLQYDKVIIAYTKDSSMFRSRFSSTSQALVAGEHRMVP
jgi:hypothetical protein